MAKHYSIRDFFRHMPNALLARYFVLRGLFVQLNWSAMKETKPDALNAAWDALEDQALRRRIEADFREISALSSQSGLLAILDEAQFQFADQPEGYAELRDKLADLPDYHSRAMVTFLEHPELWKGAVLFHHADGLSYWRKRKDLPRRPAAVDDASLALLAQKLKEHFRATDGRGRNCVVEALRRGELDYFFAYPEDHSDRSVEWVNSELAWRVHNPAFEIVFVYSQSEGSLNIHARGLSKGIDALQSIFAQAILKLKRLWPESKDIRVYDLEPLARRDFQFVRDVGGPIESVALRRIRLSSYLRKGDRITLEADPTGNREAVYDLMDRVGKTVPLRLYHVSQVELVASVADPQGKRKNKTIRITYPNSCSLKYDETDAALRQMLVASGLEPRVSEEMWQALADWSEQQADEEAAAAR